jgi:MFS-type transporter involved in bile tolerance (Atg22 family)
LADSQRVGMATILIFFVVGLLLMVPVREAPQAAAEARG